MEGRPADIHLLAAPCQYVPGNKLARSQTAGLVGLIDQWSGTQHSRHKVSCVGEIPNNVSQGGGKNQYNTKTKNFLLNYNLTRNPPGKYV